MRSIGKRTAEDGSEVKSTCCSCIGPHIGQFTLTCTSSSKGSNILFCLHRTLVHMHTDIILRYTHTHPCALTHKLIKRRHKNKVYLYRCTWSCEVCPRPSEEATFELFLRAQTLSVTLPVGEETKVLRCCMPCPVSHSHQITELRPQSRCHVTARSLLPSLCWVSAGKRQRWLVTRRSNVAQCEQKGRVKSWGSRVGKCLQFTWCPPPSVCLMTAVSKRMELSREIPASHGG